MGGMEMRFVPYSTCKGGIPLEGNCTCTGVNCGFSVGAREGRDTVWAHGQVRRPVISVFLPGTLLGHEEVHMKKRAVCKTRINATCLLLIE